MNVLLLTLLYPKDQMTEAQENAKDKIQNQINSYQHAYMEGIRQNLLPQESLTIANALPVGVYPLQYRKAWLASGWHDQRSVWNFSCLNVPPFKQSMRKRQARRFVEEWAQKSPQNRTVLIYTLYLPYLQAVAAAKKRYPDLKAVVIVTDLPNELGLSSGRTGLMKRIEYRRGKQSLDLCQRMDGFVLLTQLMAEALHISDKPFMVMEGLIQQENLPAVQEEKASVLYTGTLERELGIDHLLEAFAHMPRYELWICGQGGAEADVKEAARRCQNIRYFGFVPRQEALQLQAQAACLINPRQPSGAFTRYSFPSKTLEYMRSGKPVLCYKLEGIPDEYDPYLCYITEDGGIQRAVEKVMALPRPERERIGQEARHFVLTKKNPAVQCRRMCDFLRNVSGQPIDPGV